MTQRLYILRHGETDWNLEGRLQGQTDIPLNDRGRLQARSIQDNIAQLDITACYTSPLSRAYETAKIAVSAHPGGLEPIPHLDLQERHFGRMNGMLKTDIDIDLLQNRHLYIPIDDAGRLYPLDCEPEDVFQKRITRVIGDLTTQHDQPILLVSHGGTIRQIFRHLLQASDVLAPKNCTIYELIRDPEWHIGQIFEPNLANQE